MKRIISAIALLFICIGICVYSSIITEKKTQSLISILNETEYAINIGDNDKALRCISRLEGEWDKAEKFFSSVSETALIDELDISLGSIEKYIIWDMKEEAVVTIEECRTGLGTVLRRQKVSLDNIL